MTSLRISWRPWGSAVVRLYSGGAVGVGEATPLPTYSPDTIDDVADALHELPATLPALDPADVRGWLRRIGPLGSPAAQFAIETAAFDVAGKLLATPARALLSPHRPASRVPFNALVADEAGADAAVKRGIRTLKLKVGRGPFRDDYAVIDQLRRRLGDDIAIRVDANGHWKVPHARDYLPALADLGVDYVEEPVPGATLATLPSPVVLAADESLVAVAAAELLGNDAIGVLVLKPMLLGGLLRCLDLAARARDAGARVVVSHMFDGPIARAACAELCLALAPQLACGLDRHAGLNGWPDIITPQLGDNAVVASDTVGLGLSGAEVLWS